MRLRGRVAALERALFIRKQPPTIVLVDSFEPGPDAPPDGPLTIIVRDPVGRQRVFGSLREFYNATVKLEPSGAVSNSIGA